MQIRQDKYNVTQSQRVEVLGKGSDIRLDLKLDFNTKQPNLGSSIIGKVVDSNNNPIQGAVVKLMDDKLQPLTNTSTDANGNYSIDSIAYSSVYNMIAIAPGKILSQASPFTLLSSQSTTVNFTLQSDTNTTFGAISGTIMDSNVNPISGAIVLLYSVVSGIDNLMAITYTDTAGIFVFSELNSGNYKITVTALGYMQGDSTVTVQSGNITTISKILNINPQAADGIVSGVITDSTNSPVVGADVILYNVDNNNILTPVAFTRTNSAGIYTFINVPAGNYLVKSNQSQLITVNTPTSPNTITNTSSLPTGTYDVALGSLEGGAVVDSVTSYATNIGGPTDGSSTVTVNVLSQGDYNIAVKYIAADVNRPMKVDINGVNTGTIYELPKTAGWTVNDALTYTIPVKLMAGDNTIKFYGDGINYAPNLCLFTVNELVISTPSTIPIENNKFEFLGYYNILKTSIEFDAINKKLVVKSSGDMIHEFLPNSVYLSAALYDNNGNELIMSSALGSETADSFANTLNGVSFQYGYYLKVTHAEKSGRLKLIGNVVNSPKDLSQGFEGVDLTTAMFYITNNGIEYSTTPITTITSTIPALSYSVNKVFNGTSDYLDITNDLSTVQNLTEGAIVVKFKTTSTLPNQAIFSMTSTTDANTKLAVFSSSGTSIGRIRYEVRQGTTQLFGYNMIPYLNDGNLHTVLISVGTRGVEGYIDGVNAFTVPASHNFFADITGENTMNIGRILTSSGGQWYFNGTIEYVDIYGNELTVEQAKVMSMNNYKEITTINSTTITALSANSFDIQGLNWMTINKVQFDTTNKKLMVTSTGSVAHEFLPKNMYFGMSLYDGNNNLKASAFTLGENDGSSFATALNGVTFDYGYYLKIYHAEPWRLILTDTVAGAPVDLSNGFNNVDFNTINLYIQPTGLQYVTVPGLNSYVVTGTVPITLNAVTNVTTSTGISPQLNNTFQGSIGDSGGYVTLTVTVPTDGVYKLGVQYLCGDRDRLLQVDVNGSNSGNPYIAYKTVDWSATNAKIMNGLITLNAGSNTLKLYNKSNAPGPWVGNLTITSTTKVSYMYTTNVTTGSLVNGANLQLVGNFVGGIGDTGGYVISTVSVPTSGLYNLGVQYLNSNTSAPFRMDINGVSTNIVYNTMATPYYIPPVAPIMNIAVTLNAGVNTIKFYNSPNAVGPWIGNLIVTPTIPSSSITSTTTPVIPSTIPVLSYSMNKVFNGTSDYLDVTNDLPKVQNLTEGAIVVKFKTTTTLPNHAIFSMSDSTNASTEITVLLGSGSAIGKVRYEVKDNGVQKFGYYVVAPVVNDGNYHTAIISVGSRGVEGYVDGVNVFTLPTYKSFFADVTTPNALNIGRSITSNGGIWYFNGIIEYVDVYDNELTVEQAQVMSMNNYKATPVLSANTYNILAGALNGGATINEPTDYVGYIGGPTDGSSTVTVNVSSARAYNILVKYIAADVNRKMKLDINGVNTGTIYELPKTAGWTVNDALIYTIPVNLMVGNNTIKFHGDGTNYAPNLGVFTMESIPTIEDNKFNFLGLSSILRASIGFDDINKKLVVNSSGDQVHVYFSTVYFSATLYDNNGNEMVTASALGTGTADNFANTLNGVSFQYGYYLKVTHAEPDSRLKLTGNVINSPKDLSQGFNGVDLTTAMFYITNKGLQYSTMPITTINSTTNTVPYLSYNINKVFNGSTDYLDITNDIPKVQNLTEGSIVVKFKTTSTVPSQAIFSMSDTNNANTKLILMLSSGTSTGRVRYEVRQDTLQLFGYNMSPYLNDGIYHTTLVTVGSRGVEGYIDGINSFTVPIGQGFFGDITGENTMNIGKLVTSDGDKWYFNGTIDYIDIYDYELTVSEAEAMSMNDYKQTP
ncbi:putative mucin/carbohydrate-binding domain-containing protein [Clostridium tarantellae]|uniref:CBM6 domain-containing protein n=1 Tax=Clostridium tarantellae TaxID=39493 RepID=A0A6I1MLY6_9CLOT|nr:putative mucin/carbohydrate-binding domain-containing protein [Clostridium tarantellae]MPQ43127.1 hypothetical protein [Clostridium tarantellae]